MRVLPTLCAVLRTARTTAGDRRGSVIVEFAFIALPLLFILFGILELGLIFVAGVNLSNTALNLGRQLRVGAVVAAGSSATSTNGAYMDLNDFKTALCNGMTLVPSATCMAQLQVDVRAQTSFSNMSTGNPTSGQSFNSSSLCFYSGNPGNIVTMNVYYLWPVQTPLLTAILNSLTSYTSSNGTTTGNFFLLTASEVFKNEPNANNTNPGSGC